MQSFLEASLPGDSFIQWVDTAVNMAAASIMLGLVVALVTQAFLDLFGRRQVLRAVTRKWIARCHKEGLELATSVGAMSDLGHREHADAESEPLRVDSSVFHLGPEQVAAKYDVVFRNGIENPDFPADLILGVIASGHSQIAPRRVAEALMAVRHPESTTPSRFKEPISFCLMRLRWRSMNSRPSSPIAGCATSISCR